MGGMGNMGVMGVMSLDYHNYHSPSSFLIQARVVADDRLARIIHET